MPRCWSLVLGACALIPGAASAEALADGIQLLQVATVPAEAAKESPDSSFTDGKGMVCVEGPTRVVEAALAMKKASPLGGLYNMTFARAGQPCADRGFPFRGEEDECYVGVRMFYRSEVGTRRFKEMEAAALAAWQTTYRINGTVAQIMVACTCHPDSAIRAHADKFCSVLNKNTVGSWVHRGPKSGKMLVCDQGPFEYAARALATLKSSPLLPMHKFDQIAPVGCAALGFPLMYGATDHCFPLIHMWTRTEQPMHNCPPGGLGKDNPDCDDWGVVESGLTEKALVTQGVFKAFVSIHQLTPVLDYWPACNCHADSMVVWHEKKTKGPDVCKPLASHSPMRDFWTA